MDYQTISGLQPKTHTHTHTHVAVRILLLKNTTSVGITTATTIIIITLTTAVAVAATKDIKRNAKEILTNKENAGVSENAELLNPKPQTLNS